MPEDIEVDPVFAVAATVPSQRIWSQVEALTCGDQIQ